MIRDRGNIKWVSLMLPEHVEQLKQVMNNSNKIAKPIIDEQTYVQFNELLDKALAKKEPLLITYYENGQIKKSLYKIIEADQINKMLIVISEHETVHEFSLENIVSLEFV